MIVIGQNGTTAVPFDGGIWSVGASGVITFSAIGVQSSEYRVIMAKYSSMEKAKLAFNALITFYDQETMSDVFRMPQDNDVFALPVF